jgi:hypothetical protein
MTTERSLQIFICAIFKLIEKHEPESHHLLSRRSQAKFASHRALAWVWARTCNATSCLIFLGSAELAVAASSNISLGCWSPLERHRLAIQEARKELRGGNDPRGKSRASVACVEARAYARTEHLIIRSTSLALQQRLSCPEDILNGRRRLFENHPRNRSCTSTFRGTTYSRSEGVPVALSPGRCRQTRRSFKPS